MSNQVVFQI